MHLRHILFRVGRPRHRLRTQRATTELIAVRDGLVIVIQRFSGVLLTEDDARQLLTIAQQASQIRKPSTLCEDAIRRLARALPKADADARSTGARVQNGTTKPEYAPYDLVDTRQAAKLLRITPNGVRDLVRRGELAAHRSGGRWLLPAHLVTERADRKAAAAARRAR
jgi:excisionase family DNA binding protein